MKSGFSMAFIVLGALLTGIIYYVVTHNGYFAAWAGLIGFGIGMFMAIKISGHVGVGGLLLGIVLNCIAVLLAEFVDITQTVAVARRLDFWAAAKLFPDSLNYFQDPTGLWIYPIFGCLFIVIGGWRIWQGLNEQSTR